MSPLKLVSSAYSIGKSDTNEDAYFISERGFGVADGVSGWIDFGFSSEAFSNELMTNCKAEIIQFELEQESKMHCREDFNKMKKKRSFMSMEGLTIEDSDSEIDEEISCNSKKSKRLPSEELTSQTSSEEVHL